MPQTPSIVLAVIDRPALSTRAHLVRIPALPPGVMFQGESPDVPAFLCGGCGTALVVGVDAQQLVDRSRPVESVGAHVPTTPLVIAHSDRHISTIRIPASVMIVSDGQLVLTCPCGASNEMVHPNVWHDRAH